ncbi:F-actin-capping protein subunit beta [Sporobolomyces koalae]|uniref:F-actin-capping protein subunit beta n=1 Tax=Sporobolomyces koalae TaxID=500713 RepID=UPI003181EF4D
MSHNEDATLTASLDLLRRLPPDQISANLDSLVNILEPDTADDLLSSVDQPLKIAHSSTSRDYLICDYNRDGDSYRSPWTNEYTPALTDGTTPSANLRKLEIAMNQAFDVYRDLYYEGGLSSVYLWDTEETTSGAAFAGVVLLKKSTDSNDSTASWDSIHVFESIPPSSTSSSAAAGRTCGYKLTSTVMLSMSKPITTSTASSTTTSSTEGQVNLGGSMTRQHESTGPLDTSSNENVRSSHIENLGKMIEEMEIKMRNLLAEVYFSKTKDIVGTLRNGQGFGVANQQKLLQGELVGLLRGRKIAN